MNADQPETNKNHTLMIAVVVLEAIVILLILAFGAYLAVKILYYKSTAKISESISGSTTPVSATSADCPAGKTGTSAGADYKVSGKTRLTVGGKEVELCCTTSENKTAQAKVCTDKNNSYTVYYSKVNGQYVLASEMYPQGEKRCIKSYKENGESAEICL